ncbi:hypothetical protein BKA62DRAFT_202226 [Auriculariales sp. MPI-PUGE-AT-0066]|nr:hypothetical protein BKA62DRAFT_202226 [Auriculariales sp. MPI-PUGE-AT-0066]
MQQSRLLAVVFTFLAFAMVAFAGPVAKTAVTDLAVRTSDSDKLDAILQILVDLQVKIKAILVIVAKLSITADISSYCNQIVVLVNAAVKAIVAVGVVVDLSATVKITAIAQVCAAIIIDISACIKVFINILVNITAVINLDLAIHALVVQLGACISGILVIIAKLCVNININVGSTSPRPSPFSSDFYRRGVHVRLSRVPSDLCSAWSVSILYCTS